MSITELIAAKSPITNLVDLLGIQHSNPLGIDPVWQMVILAVLALVMEVFHFQIRWRQKPQYYPILFAFLGVITLGLYYYCFQSGLPTALNSARTGEYTAFCWFCDNNIVGWGWAIVGIITFIAIAYILLCAIQQTCAQLTMYANPELVKTKPWKELKLGVFISLLPVVLVLIGLLISPTATSWMFLGGGLAFLAFVIVKMVLDCKRTKSALWGIGINLAFLIGIIPILTLSVSLIECSYAYIIAILAFFTGSKARKKEAKK